MENKENEFSIITKKLILENANYCCESCGEQQLKLNYCKKAGEKILQHSKYYPTDHINEH
jgi:hypothetical protein